MIIAVVKQQFVMGINCSIFLYRNLFGDNHRLAMTRESFRIAQVSHCAVQQVMHHVVCTHSLCVVCNGLLSAEFSTVNTGLEGLCFENLVSVEYS